MQNIVRLSGVELTMHIRKHNSYLMHLPMSWPARPLNMRLVITDDVTVHAGTKLMHFNQDLATNGGDDAIHSNASDIAATADINPMQDVSNRTVACRHHI